MMTHKFKRGDRGKTRDGSPYEVMITDIPGMDFPLLAYIVYPHGDTIAHFLQLDGRASPDKELPYDLMPPPACQTVWVALLRDSNGHTRPSNVFYGRPAALNGRDTGCEVLGVSSVTITEGEWLE